MKATARPPSRRRCLPLAAAALLTLAGHADGQRLHPGGSHQVAPLAGGGFRLFSAGIVGTGADQRAAGGAVAASLALPAGGALFGLEGAFAAGAGNGTQRLLAVSTAFGLARGSLRIRVGATGGEGRGAVEIAAGATFERSRFSFSVSSGILPGRAALYRDTLLSADSVPLVGRVLIAEAEPRRTFADAEAGYRSGVGRWAWGIAVGGRVGAAVADWWARASLGIRVAPGITTGIEAGHDAAVPGRAAAGARASLFVRLDAPFHHGTTPDRLRAPAPTLAITTRNGETRFAIEAQRARSVELAGDFTDWQAIGLERDPAGFWRTTLRLAPGLYHITMRFDGGPWIVPPGIPAVPDELGGESGVFEVLPSDASPIRGGRDGFGLAAQDDVGREEPVSGPAGCCRSPGTR